MNLARKIKRNTNYKVWPDGFHPVESDSNELPNEKVNYMHYNPVEEQIVENAEDYLYSSARNYNQLQGLRY